MLCSSIDWLIDCAIIPHIHRPIHPFTHSPIHPITSSSHHLVLSSPRSLITSFSHHLILSSPHSLITSFSHPLSSHPLSSHPLLLPFSHPSPTSPDIRRRWCLSSTPQPDGIDTGNACLKSIAGVSIHVERATPPSKKVAPKQT